MVQHSSIDHSGVMSYASNANQTSTANYGGAASTVSRGDHIHLSTGGSGGVATDAIWDAAGDLAVGTGANTAARLAAGAAGAVLAMGNSAVIWNAGTAFPASKATNDRYWRTDLGMEFYWDGTRWVSTTLYSDVYPTTSALEPYSASIGARRLALWGAAASVSLWIVSVHAAFYITGGTALSASHKWVVTFQTEPSSTAHATLTIDSGVTDAYRAISAAVGAVIVSTDVWSDAALAKTGTPGTIYCEPRIAYRRIAT